MSNNEEADGDRASSHLWRHCWHVGRM